MRAALKERKHTTAALVARAAAAAAILLLAGFADALAGGVMLYEVGTPDMFTAGAGWAARAQDAATVLTNPAGLARIKGGDLLLGAGALYGDYQFTPNARTTVDGGDGGVSIGWFPNGGAYYAREISPQWSIGLAATSNFGLSSSYDRGWVGRYYVDESTLIGLMFLPTAAYRVSPKLSLGAALNAMYGILDNKVSVNNVDPSLGDGQMKLSSNDLGFGGNFGALFEPSAKVRFGATYTTEVALDFTDRPEFTNLAPGIEAALDVAGLLDADLGMEIKVPQTAIASFYWDVSPAWALMGDVGWQDWSRFGGVNMQVATNPPTSLATQLPYKDTWRGALGLKHRLADAWLLSAGASYDSPIVEDADRSVTLPAGAVWRIAAGAQRQLTEKFEIGFGYEYQSSGDLSVDQVRGPLAGRVSGSYDNAMAHVLSLQGHWRF